MADKLFNAIQDSTKDPSEVLYTQITDNEVSISSQDKVPAIEVTDGLLASVKDDFTVDLTALFTGRNEEIASRSLKLVAHSDGGASSVSTLSTLSGLTDTCEDTDTIALEGLSVSENISQETLLIAAECVLEDKMTRKFNSAYASVHSGEEPAVTNWSHDFKE